jgi:AcrR family transcriptional regulator
MAVSRRDRKRIAARHAVRMAGLRLALEHGPENLTVQAICDAADIGSSTFFTYFSSKDEVLRMEVPWTEERLREEMDARPLDEPPLTSLRAVVKELGGDLASRWEEARLWKRLARAHPQLIRRADGWPDRVLPALVGMVSERTGADPERDVGPMLTVAVAAAAARVALHRWCQAPEPPGGRERLDMGPFIDEAFDRLESGL